MAVVAYQRDREPRAFVESFTRGHSPDASATRHRTGRSATLDEFDDGDLTVPVEERPAVDPTQVEF